MTSHLHCGRFRFSLASTSRPLVMGILNLTPDSFSDGGRYALLDAALAHAEQMLADGVDIIDIGGESTRPGAQPASEQEELDRVMPAVFALRDCGKALSVDTSKPRVMAEVLAAGADMINDVNALRAEGALRAVSEHDCGICIMHMQGEPRTMQQNPLYDDVVAEVSAFLEQRIAQLEGEGIARRRICIDPGFGFGKTLAHNLALLRGLNVLRAATGVPILAGLSRKTMIGTITGKPVEQRLAGSLGAAMAAVAQGARIVRVHDVAETVDALRVFHAGMQAEFFGE